MTDIRKMQLGHVVDFVISYNDRQKQAEKKANKPQKIKATQNDINSFFG